MACRTSANRERRVFYDELAKRFALVLVWFLHSNVIPWTLQHCETQAWRRSQAVKGLSRRLLQLFLDLLRPPASFTE